MDRPEERIFAVKVLHLKLGFGMVTQEVARFCPHSSFCTPRQGSPLSCVGRYLVWVATVLHQLLPQYEAHEFGAFGGT